MSNYYNSDEISSSEKFSSSIFETIKLSFSGKIKLLITYIIIGFIGRALLLFNANIIGMWTDIICDNPVICKKEGNILINSSFFEVFLLLLVLTFLGFILLLIFRLNIGKIGTLATSKLYDEVTARVSRFPVKFFDTNPFGRIITRFSSDYAAVTRMSGGPLGEVLSLVFDLLLFGILILFASPYFISVILFILIVNYFLYKKNKYQIRKERRQLNLLRAPTITHFAESVQGLKSIRVYGKESVFKRKFSEKLKDFILQRIKTNNLINLFSLKMGFLNVSILFLTGIIGAFLMKKSLITLGEMIVVLTFVLMISSTIQVFFEWLTIIEEALTGIERMDYYLKLDLEKGNVLPKSCEFNISNQLKEDRYSILTERVFSNEKNVEITVKNLSIKYSENSPLTLKDINFTVNPGEKVGIIGKTGCGKSTLIQAIYYLYPFFSGSIQLNGYEPELDKKAEKTKKSISLSEYRSALSIISQEPILFSGSLRDNLILDKKISDEEIIEVTKRLGLRKVFSGGKKALDIELKENGGYFSLGEKQLLCMARCILQDRPVVLLDEATSSIDPYSEEILVNAVNQFLQGKTQVIVAHQLSTIESCDRILWLDAGKMVMFGVPELVLTKFKNFDEVKIN